MDNYLELYKNMIPNSIKLSYKGTVTFELIDSILQIISNRLDVIEGNINIRRRVYSVLMECLQNLSLHIEEHKVESLEYDCKSAILTIENGFDNYVISTGNFIQNSKIPTLKSWLDQINNSSFDELKVLYNKILTNNTYNTKGGGGLGFVDIARKINGKLDYHFEKIDDSYSFFQLEVQIKKSN
jgi:hypothetical protein